MDAVVITTSLADAAVTRLAQTENAKKEFDKAMARAAATAAVRQRAIERNWSAARVQARRIAGVRAGLWRKHHELDSAELRLRLAIHQFRLSPSYPVRMTDAQRRGEIWYVRMITNELVRRGALPRKEAA